MNIEEAKKAFAEYDRDGDGQITLQGKGSYKKTSLNNH